MFEGDPEVPFTSASTISHRHMALSLAEKSSRPICGREWGPRNLYPQSNANFQFSTLGKQKLAHTEHSGQEPLKNKSQINNVDLSMDSAMRFKVGASGAFAWRKNPT